MRTGESGTYESGVTSWTSELQLLLVEGDPGVAEGYKLKLELDGYVVRVACGRAAAMAALAQRLPDLVFLDVRPSVLDGSVILNDIRTTKETRYMPVVLLSNDSKDELVRRGLQLAGGEWVIQSPGRPRLALGYNARSAWLLGLSCQAASRHAIWLQTAIRLSPHALEKLGQRSGRALSSKSANYASLYEERPLYNARNRS